MKLSRDLMIRRLKLSDIDTALMGDITMEVWNANPHQIPSQQYRNKCRE